MKDTSPINIDNREAISMGWLNLEDTVGFISNNMTRIPYDEKLASDYVKIFDNLKSYMYPELVDKQTKEKNE